MPERRFLPPQAFHTGGVASLLFLELTQVCEIFAGVARIGWLFLNKPPSDPGTRAPADSLAATRRGCPNLLDGLIPILRVSDSLGFPNRL